MKTPIPTPRKVMEKAAIIVVQDLNLGWWSEDDFIGREIADADDFDSAMHRMDNVRADARRAIEILKKLRAIYREGRPTR